jgi:hypothetical protein
MHKSSNHRPADLRKRLTETKTQGRSRCWVFDCPNPPGNATPKGLGRFCRKHLEHYRRHGDPLKASYTASELLPHRRAATSWIKANADDRVLGYTLLKLTSTMAGAGRAVEVRVLRRLSSAQKARAVWARLRAREVPAEKLLVTILAVMLCYEADIQKGKREFRQVQVAKWLTRMAGGTIKRWPTHHTDISLPKERVVRWFASSEGLVLRDLGKTAEAAVELIAPERSDEIARFVGHHG